MYLLSLLRCYFEQFRVQFFEFSRRGSLRGKTAALDQKSAFLLVSASLNWHCNGEGGEIIIVDRTLRAALCAEHQNRIINIF